jgi:hypothetical protein
MLRNASIIGESWLNVREYAGASMKVIYSPRRARVLLVTVHSDS